jgi:hypothetical protein
VTRLRPLEIAILPLPGLTDNVTVETATDEQFDCFTQACGAPVNALGIQEWSFDDRCGVINHMLKYGLLEANKNSSFWELKSVLARIEINSETEQKTIPVEEQNQFGNNSSDEQKTELFVCPEPAPQADLPVSDENENETSSIVYLGIEKSSETEQNEIAQVVSQEASLLLGRPILDGWVGIVKSILSADEPEVGRN